MSHAEVENSLAERGWAIIDADDRAPLDQVRAEVARLIGGRPDALPQALRAIEPAALNELLKSANHAAMQHAWTMLAAFQGPLRSVTSPSVYYQRRPYLRVNVPGHAHTATPAHADTLYGHSPHCLTVWIPLHDIRDRAGLYVFDRSVSAEIIRSYKFDAPIEEVVRDRFPRPEGIRLRYGQAILFRCGLVHGAHPNPGPDARVSLDTRVQSMSEPLFQKGYDLFSRGRFA